MASEETKVGERSEMEIQTSHLETDIELLATKLERLVDKLSPVMKNSQLPRLANGATPMKTMESPLAGFIQRQDTKLCEAIDTIEFIINSLAI